MSEPDWSRSANGDPAPQLRIVPAETSTSPHWHGLLDAGNEVAFGSAWLALQCSRIAGVSAGLLLIRHVDASARRSVGDVAGARPRCRAISCDSAETAYAERRMVVAPGRVGPDASPAQPVALIVALPLGTAREPIATAAIALTTTAGKPAANPCNRRRTIALGRGLARGTALGEALQGSLVRYRTSRSRASTSSPRSGRSRG